MHVKAVVGAAPPLPQPAVHLHDQPSLQVTHPTQPPGPASSVPTIDRYRTRTIAAPADGRQRKFLWHAFGVDLCQDVHADPAIIGP